MQYTDAVKILKSAGLSSGAGAPFAVFTHPTKPIKARITWNMVGKTRGVTVERPAIPGVFYVESEGDLREALETCFV